MDYQEYYNMGHAQMLQYIQTYLAALSIPDEKKSELGMLINTLYADALGDSFSSGVDEGYDQGWAACEKDKRSGS